MAGQKKSTENLSLFFPPRRLQQFMNCCSALELQLLEEGNTLRCWHSSKIHAWTACFLVKHVSFYRGAPTTLFIKAHLSDEPLAGWRLHNWSWFFPQGAGTPHRIYFPLFTAFKRSSSHTQQGRVPKVEPKGNYCQAGWNKVTEKKLGLKCQP